MQALHLPRRSDEGDPGIRPLTLPTKVFGADGKPDDTEARRRLAREGADRPMHRDTFIPCTGDFLGRRLEAGQEWTTDDTSTLSFVLDGHLDVPSTRGRVQLNRGGTLLAEGMHTLSTSTGCCLVQLDVSGWAPHAGPLTASDPRAQASSVPNFKRAYRGAGNDELAYFADFDGLLPDEAGRATGPHPMEGFWFAMIPAGFAIDWHPEIVNQLVVVLEGAMEIETSGDSGRVEQFLPGDVLLAQDRTGVGHVDRFHQDTTLAAIVFPDQSLWPLNSAH